MMAGPSEHTEAVVFMRAVRGAEAQWPELRWLFAVPNGGWRAKRTAAAMKAEGAKPGVPDYLLPVARGGFSGLAIELKRSWTNRAGRRRYVAAGKRRGRRCRTTWPAIGPQNRTSRSTRPAQP